MDDAHTSSTERGGQTSDGQMDALAAVAQMAHERAGHFPGFDCILAFIPYEVLMTQESSYDLSLFLTPEEQSARVAKHFSSHEARFDLILSVLKQAIESKDEPSITLASKIVARMQSGGPNAPVARPLLYLLRAPEGIAVALAIHDEFWTGKW